LVPLLQTRTPCRHRPDLPIRGRPGMNPSHHAATNKCLAQSNKSRRGTIFRAANGKTRYGSALLVFPFGGAELRERAGCEPSFKRSLLRWPSHAAPRRVRKNKEQGADYLSAVAAGPEPIYAVREHYCPRPIATGQIGQKFAPSCGDARGTSTRNDTRPHTRRAVVEVRS
jgi:hypothetical protein